MPLSVASGAFNTNTVTGNQAVTGVGFTPFVILLFGGLHPTALGNSATAYFTMGAARSSTIRADMHGLTEDGVGTSDSYRGLATTGCWRERDVAGAVIWNADFVSMDADGFTINWATVNGTARRIFYVALGGTDITNANIGSTLSGTGTGNLAVTGVGFQPDLLLSFVSKSGTPLGDAANAAANFGVARSSTSRWAMGWFSADAVANADEQRFLNTTRFLARIDISLAYVQEFDLVSFDTDGFTYNRVTNAGDVVWVWIALRGTYQAALGTFLQPTVTGNQSVTGAGFQPLLDVFASVSQTAGTTPTADSKTVLGAAISSTNRRVTCMAATDALTIMETDRRSSESLCLTHIVAGTPTVTAEADFVSQDADGFTVNWTTVDATQRDHGYLAWASQAVAAGSVVSPRTFALLGVGS